MTTFYSFGFFYSLGLQPRPVLVLTHNTQKRQRRVLLRNFHLIQSSTYRVKPQ